MMMMGSGMMMRRKEKNALCFTDCNSMTRTTRGKEDGKENLSRCAAAHFGTEISSPDHDSCL